MEIKRIELLEALTMVKPGLSQKDFIEQANTFVFNEDCIITYNDLISVYHPFTSNLRASVKSDELLPLINKLNGDVIEMEADSVLSIKCGRIHTKLVIENELKLPLDTVNNLPKFKKLPTNFIEGIRFLLPCTSNDASSPYIAVCIRGDNRLHATDNFILAEYQLDSPMDCDQVLLPSMACSVIINYELLKYCITDGWMHFKTKAGTIISCRTIDGKYPPSFDAYIKKGGTPMILPSLLPDALERGHVFAKRGVMSDEVVYMSIQDKKLTLKTKGLSGSVYKETLPIKFENDVLFGVIYSVLDRILKHTNRVLLAPNGKVISFHGDNWVLSAVLIDIAKVWDSLK